MAMNPSDLPRLKERYDLFKTQHPKFFPFLQAAGQEAVREGTIAEIRIIPKEGQDFVTNIKLTADDVKTIEMLRGLR